MVIIWWGNDIDNISYIFRVSIYQLTGGSKHCYDHKKKVYSQNHTIYMVDKIMMVYSQTITITMASCQSCRHILTLEPL